MLLRPRLVVAALLSTTGLTVGATAVPLALAPASATLPCTIIGTPGPDTLVGTDGPDRICGSGGDDIIRGGLGDDTIVGGSGNDILEPGAGQDSVYGGADNDLFRVADAFTDCDPVTGLCEPDADQIHGGDGADNVSYAAYGAASNVSVRVTLDGEANDGDYVGDPYPGSSGATEGDNVFDDVEMVTGSGGNDTLVGGARNDRFDGRGGADVFIGGGGTDTVSYGNRSETIFITVDDTANDGAVGEGDDVRSDIEVVLTGSGDDSIQGGAGAEGIFTGAGDDVVDGGPGDDVIDGGPGQDIMAGGVGSDTVSYASRGSAVTATLGAAVSDDGSALDGPEGARDTIQPDVENVAGGSGDDTLSGGDGDNRIDGGGGDDRLAGGAGGDVFEGGDGVDTVSYADHPKPDYNAPVTVSIAAGSWRTDGSPYDGADGARDEVRYSVENVIGSPGRDLLTGSNKANRITGGPGLSEVWGGGGADRLIGEGQSDYLYGGPGDDVFRSGGADGWGGDHVYGDDGDDLIIAPDDVTNGFAGGGGRDTLSYEEYTSSVSIRFDLGRVWDAGGYREVATIAGFEIAIGGPYGDELHGDEGDNVLIGGPGKDEFEGGRGYDLIRAADGEQDKLIDCGDGADPRPVQDTIDPQPQSCY